MRCKKHNTDLSSIVGVCASCLRERLIKLIQAQEQAEAQSQAQAQPQAQSKSQNHRNSNTNPPSVSPYNNIPVNSVTRVQRTSNKPQLNHSLSDQRFYNSPQIAVSSTSCIGATSSSNKKKKNLIRFSSFSNLFRSNGRDGDSDSNHGASVSTSGKPTSVTSSPLWFSNVRQKNKPVNVTESSTIGKLRKQRCIRDRGMSPVRSSDDGGEEDLSEGSSGYESAEAESFKQTPKKTPASQTAGRRGGVQRSTTELIFCLSPLVRASPNRLWSMKGKPPVDVGRFSGDVRPHISNVKSFCANRSRKLADFGRSNPNR